MAVNYNAFTPVFKPLSYDEMVKPVDNMTNEHRQNEQAFAALEAQADDIQGKINNTDNPIAKAQLEAYYNDLKARANDLADHGINARTRQDVYNMGSRYAKEVNPVATAYQQHMAAVAEEQKRMAEHPESMYERKVGSIDNYLQNPSYTRGQVFDLSDVSNKFSNILAQFQRDETGHGVSSFMAGNTKYQEWLQNHGLNSKDIVEGLKDPNYAKKNSAIMQAINMVKEQFMDTSGIMNWRNEDGSANLESIGRYEGALNRVLPYAIGPVNRTHNVDQGWMDDRRFARAKALQKTPEQNKVLTDTKYLDVANSSEVMAKWNKDRDLYTSLEKQGLIKKWKDAGYLDSNNRMTDKGKKAYEEEYKAYKEELKNARDSRDVIIPDIVNIALLDEAAKRGYYNKSEKEMNDIYRIAYTELSQNIKFDDAKKLITNNGKKVKYFKAGDNGLSEAGTIKLDDLETAVGKDSGRIATIDRGNYIVYYNVPKYGTLILPMNTSSAKGKAVHFATQNIAQAKRAIKDGTVLNYNSKSGQLEIEDSVDNNGKVKYNTEGRKLKKVADDRQKEMNNLYHDSAVRDWGQNVVDLLGENIEQDNKVYPEQNDGLDYYLGN